MPAELLAAEGTAENVLSSDTLLTGRMLEDEQFNMVTASDATPAKAKIHFVEELCAAKMAAFVQFHLT